MKKIPLSTLLWICYGVFIVYATTIPFNVVKSWAELHHNISVISWRPFYNTDLHDFFSRGDLIANVLFFIPFGFFGFYSLQNNKWPDWSRIIFLSALGTALSAFVEFLQIFTIDRNTSDTDLITNTSGTILGIICARLIKPSLIKRLYNNHAASFTQAKGAFPFLGIMLVIAAGALAPFDFAIDRISIINKLHLFFSSWSSLQDLNKKDLIVFMYYSSLFSFMSITCFKQWRIKNFRSRTVALTLVFGFLLEGFQIFMVSRAPGLGSFLGILSGTCAGLVVEWFSSRHYHPSIAWVLLIFTTILLLLFNLAPPVQYASKLGSFLRFSSKSSESIQGLMNFIQITSQFIPVGFVSAFLIPSRNKMPALTLPALFFPLLVAPLLFLHHWGVPRLYDIAVVIIAEAAILIGCMSCLWAWPIFTYYCQRNPYGEDETPDHPLIA
jgi:Predicted integral membrane protein